MKETTHHIAGLPPLAVRMMKEFVIRFRDTPITEAWRVQMLMNTLLTQLSADGDEGRRAFLSKSRLPTLPAAFGRRAKCNLKLTMSSAHALMRCAVSFLGSRQY